MDGCGVCVDMHARQSKQSGETDERLHAVAAWRDTPYFSDAERAALALTEAVTRLSDRAGRPDRHFAIDRERQKHIAGMPPHWP
ncbi:MAG TPA: carboxymuconolactone decarboxylase family protein [Bryobacteraceae bacterium]|nr:carboxymuconolactone decarboxylase family protein [Bryobacteraceae bacterium]